MELFSRNNPGYARWKTCGCDFYRPDQLKAESKENTQNRPDIIDRPPHEWQRRHGGRPDSHQGVEYGLSSAA